MAFMGIAVMWLLVIGGIIGFGFFAAAVCFIISSVIKKKYEKNLATGMYFDRPPVSITVFKVIGFVFLLPAAAAVLLILAAVGGAVIKTLRQP